ncbi:MAG: DUF2059 domain-containing protein [Marinibacterium sp.]
MRRPGAGGSPVVRGVAYVWAAALVCVVAWPGPVRAQPVEDLASVLRIDDLMGLVREEGLRNAAEILPKTASGTVSDPILRAAVDVFDPVGMQADMREALELRMSPAQMRDAVAFFSAPAGRNLIELELSARRAIMDPQIEEIARAAWQERSGREDDALVDAIRRFVRINDLITRNAGATMVARYEYLQGLAEGGGKVIDEDAALMEIWAHEPEVVKETESWLMGYLLLAYGPVPVADIEAYNEFSLDPAGEALNDAIFAGFETSYRRIARALGRIAGEAGAARDL